jgi:ABC-type Fe3+/spermidine/putrescine transport system ATPase subunit
VADRVAIMNRGRIEQVGTPQEIYNKPLTRFVRDFLGRTVTLHSLLEQRGAAQAVRAAYRRYRTLQHALRLQGDRYARVDSAEITDEERVVTALWESVLGTTATA